MDTNCFVGPKTILSYVRGGAAELWDTKTGELRGNPIAGAVYPFAFSPDSKVIVMSSEDQVLRCYDTRAATVVGEPIKHGTSSLSLLKFSPDGRILLTGGDDNTVRLWDRQTGKAVCEALQHDQARTQHVTFHQRDAEGRSYQTGDAMTTHTVYAAEFSPDCRFVLTGSSDGEVRLWNARTGKLLGTGGPARKRIDSVAFSPDGSTFLTAAGATVGRWDTMKMQAHQTLFLSSRVSHAVFSPGGRVFATARIDGRVELWDSHVDQLLGPPLVHQARVTIEFSADGQMIAAFDGAPYVWAIAAPAADEPRRLQLSVEVRTGQYFDEGGDLRRLTVDEWINRHRQLDELGGFCDVVSWVDAKEKSN